MDFGSIGSMITQVGFPIFCCVVMGWYVNKTNESHKDETAKLNQMHKEEVTRLIESHAEETNRIIEAVNNNTLAVQRLCDRLTAKGEL